MSLEFDFPAFILGNGPHLPVDRLGLLSDQFTVGVNRICQSGFVPSVLMWVDSTVYTDPDNKELMDSCGALLICDKSLRKRQFHYGLRPLIGNRGIQTPFPKPWELAVNGNTACGAARWALSLGCPKAYLLGMGAAYDGDNTDFYGVNKRHKKSTLNVMRKELVRLKVDYGDRVVSVPTGDCLEYVVKTLPPIDHDVLRGAVLDKIQEPT